MNIETVGNHTLGQLIGLYRNSAERCKEILEILEELQDAQDSLRLAKEDVRLAKNDEDEAEDIKEYEDKVIACQKAFNELFEREIFGLQARATNLASDTAFGAEKINP
jgi:Asp/Glu/hydantoin racemase